MPTSVKIFLNKYPSAEDAFWSVVADKLEGKGYTVHRETSDCDIALMMNVSFLNPSAFKNKIGFYLDMPEQYHSNEIFWMTHIMSPILKRYYDSDKLINVYGMTTDNVVDKIINYHSELSNEAH